MQEVKVGCAYPACPIGTTLRFDDSAGPADSFELANPVVGFVFKKNSGARGAFRMFCGDHKNADAPATPGRDNP